MSKIFKIAGTLFLGIFLFSLILTKVGWQRFIEAGFLFLSWQGLSLVVLTFLMAAISVVRWALILRSQGRRFGFSDLWGIWTVGYALSYLTPMAFLGGEPFRVYLAKKKLKTSWQESVVSVVADKFLDATLFFSITLGGFLLLLWHTPISFLRMLGIGLGAAVILLGPLSFFYFRTFQKESALSLALKWLGLEKKITQTNNGQILIKVDEKIIEFFSFQNKYFWQGLGLSFIRYFLLVSRSALLLYFLERIFSPAKTLAVYAANNLSLLFPLPAALGSMEVLDGLTFNALGLSFASGTLFSMVFRAADIVLVIVGLIFLVRVSFDLAQQKILGFFNDEEL